MARRTGLRPMLVVFASLFLAHCAARAGVERAVGGFSQIAGPWDILSFNGYYPPRLDGDGGRHAFVNIDADGGLSYSVGCNYSGMRGRIDNLGRLIELPGDSIVTTMGCGAERDRRDSAFLAFFRSKPTILQAGDDLVLQSRGARLVLQRPAERRANALPPSIDLLYGRWSAGIVYFDVEPGHNRNLMALLDGEPAMLRISAEGVTFDFDCEQVRSQVRLTAPGALEFASPQRRVQPACRLPQSDRDLAASLVAGAAEAEMIDERRIHLVAGPVRAVLERVAD